MKILIINKFLFPKGGDAVSAIAEGRLLEAYGHEVIFWGMTHQNNPNYPHKDYLLSFTDYDNPKGVLEKITMASNILYSFEAKTKVEMLIKKVSPDMVHLHNFAHQISPSILHVFKKYKIPIVMTMHDYKVVCPVYTLCLNGKPCEMCSKGKYYNCVLNKCAKNSYYKSLVNCFEMYLHHNIMKLYDLIDVYISPSNFLRNKCLEMGFNKKVELLPHFVNYGEYQPKYGGGERYIAYIGRLSPEKGIKLVITAVNGLDIILKIVGDGPFKDELVSHCQLINAKNVQFLGYKNEDELKDIIGNSMFVLAPSECYEVFGRTIIDAFERGKPVIGARIGGIPELVKDNETGLTFKAGDSEDLREKIQYLLDNPNKVEVMGKLARSFVKRELTAEAHYEKLMMIYNKALAMRKL